MGKRDTHTFSFKGNYFNESYTSITIRISRVNYLTLAALNKRKTQSYSLGIEWIPGMGKTVLMVIIISSAALFVRVFCFGVCVCVYVRAPVIFYSGAYLYCLSHDAVNIMRHSGGLLEYSP